MSTRKEAWAVFSVATQYATNSYNSYVDNYGEKPKFNNFGGGNPIEEHEYIIIDGRNMFGNTTFQSEYNTLSQKIFGKGTPYTKQNTEYDDIKDFARIVFPNMYKNAGSPKFEIGLIPENNNPGGTTDRKLRQVNGCWVVTYTKIIVTPSNLKNILTLGETVSHELGHGVDYTSGDYARWANRYSPFAAHFLSEVKSYTRDMTLNDGDYNIGQLVFFQGLQKKYGWKF